MLRTRSLPPTPRRVSAARAAAPLAPLAPLALAAAAVFLAVLARPAAAEPPKNRQEWTPGVATGAPDPEAIIDTGDDKGFWGPPVGEIKRPHGDVAAPYASREGRFTATFPLACTRLELRRDGSGDGDAAPGGDAPARRLAVSCPGSGAWVEARLGAARGLSPREAGEAVVAEVRRLQAARDAVAVRQAAVHEDYGDHGVLDGLEVEARARKGDGELRVRGLLRGDDMYFVVAWRPDGHVLDAGEYQQFFLGFRPWFQ